jgi:hypothetical protein
MNQINHTKQIPINDLFKNKQEPVYIFSLNYNYKELMQNYGFNYEIWEEKEGFMIGGAIEVDGSKYLLKAALNHTKQHSQVGVFVLADTNNLEHATKKLIKTLSISLNETDNSAI